MADHAMEYLQEKIRPLVQQSISLNVRVQDPITLTFLIREILR